MSGIRRRSLVEQAGRLSVLGVLIAVLALAAVAAPRESDRVLDGYLKQTVGGMSAGVRDISGVTDATGYVLSNRPGSAPVTVSPTWDAMPKTLVSVRAGMPAALREVTRGGHYLGIASPTAGTLANGLGGFRVQQAVPGAPRGTQLLTLEGYPELRSDARLVSGTWPTTPSLPRPGRVTIPVVIADAAARSLHWRVGQTQTISSWAGTISLVLTGTVAPRPTDSQFWDMSRTRKDIATFQNNDGETFHAEVAWTDPASWPQIAPMVNGVLVWGWYPVSADKVSLTRLDDLQNALTTTLVGAIPIDDGTQDGHVLQLASALPQMLNLFDNTVQATRTVLTAATIAALGLGVLVLLATITFTLGARRSVRELLRMRGASAPQLAGSTAADIAVWAVPAAGVGAAAGVLLVPSLAGMPPVGVRDVVAALVCAALPVLLAAGAVLLESMPPRLAAIVAQSRWVGEALLVLLAVAAVIVTVTGGSDAATAVAGLAVGLAASVLLLRAVPWVLRAVTALVRRGAPAMFIGLRDAGGAGWLVVASVTATATGVLAILLGLSAARAQQQGQTPGPMLLAPGALAVVAVAAGVCIAFAAAAFAVSVVSDRGPRRARAGGLRRLGLAGPQRAGVSLWGTIPLTVVAVAAGALVGAWSAGPVLGAIAASSGRAVAVVVAPGAVAAVAGGILVLVVVIEAMALAADARVLRRSS